MTTENTEATTVRTRGEAAIAGMRILEPVLATAKEPDDKLAFMKAALKLAQETSSEDLDALAALASVASQFVEATVLTRALIGIMGRPITEADIEEQYKEAQSRGVFNES